MTAFELPDAEPIPADLSADPASGCVPVNSASQAAAWMAFALRDVDLNPTEELLLFEAVFLRLGAQGAAAAVLAVIIDRARQTERQTVLRELAPEVTAAAKLAKMRVDERARHEAQTTEQLTALRTELETSHQAELERLRAAWSTVADVLG